MEKAKRKLESDLKMTQENVEELERVRGDLEGNVKRLVNFYNNKISYIYIYYFF